ncbi:VWA domain-containing protein [uncultured Roseovarius sp.]|uniref:vWA domain-containing protein n=1 Tax=uncultured Roseovarius sp. TaxID=293344 RepID=UPI002612E973|nr:VWA domain-containing protein [uncultured Roseovarius sp.]
MRLVLITIGFLFAAVSAYAQQFALEAPARVGMRATFDVGWTAPQAKGGLIEIRPEGENARRVGYAYLQKNPQAIGAPEAPGDYVIVLTFEGEDRVSQPLRVDPASATLSAPGTVDAGSSVTVTWDGPDNRNDFVTFAQPGADPIRGAGYAYTGNSKDGTVTVQAPQDAGTYDIVYVSGKTVLARHPVQVAGISATLSAAGTVDAGSTVTVTWDGPDNRNDHVTFAQPGADPIRGASYAYTGNSKDGTVTVQAPQDAGTYDIVYVSGKTVLARHPVQVGGISATLRAAAEVAAGARLEVGFEGPDNNGDLITFAARDGGPIKPASYGYTGNAPADTVTLRAFEEPGSYDVVYLSGGRVIGRAPVEVVPPRMEILAPKAVEARLVFEAEWRGTGNQGDRILMVAPGQTRGDVYTYIDPLVETVRLTAPEAEGAYELVYVTRGGRELARRAIEVTPAPVEPGEIEVLPGPGLGLGPRDAVEVILDASGSMLQRQNGERRIEIAKRTLSELVSDTIPAGTGFALRVFGNREADACRTDLELALGPHDPASARAVIGGITAINLAKTPIARSIALSAQDLAGVEGSRVLIVITDGEETCEGSPGQAIEALRAQGTDVRINIVGYAIDDANLARTFESWAAAGGGGYFDAADAEELGAALRRAAAAPFEIRDEAGALVGAGLAGDAPVTVPADTYAVRIGGRDVSVVVEPGARTRVTP